jgi:predicted outer membrane repeat protein
MRVMLTVFAVAMLSACSLVVDTDPFKGPLRALVASAGPDQVVSPGAAVVLDASASQNPNGGGPPLEFEWEQIEIGDGPEVSLDLEGARASFTAPAMRARLRFRVTVTAGAAEPASDEVEVVVNSSPIARTGADREVMSARRVFLDAGESYDPDDEPLTYQWSQISGDAVTLTGADTPMAIFVSPGAAGTLGFLLTVCDANGACASDEVEIVVHRYMSVDAGWFHGVALRSDGTVWTWGEDQHGALGIGVTAGYNHQPYPTRVRGLPPVTRAVAGYRASYAQTEAGDTYAWGINCYGEAGYAAESTCDTVSEPRLVDEPFQGFARVARADSGAIYIADDGVATAIGYNPGGQLGTCPPPYTLFDRTELPGLFHDISLSRSIGNFALAIGTDGRLRAWGTNANGQLGNGTTSAACTDITQIDANTNWTAISAGNDHAAAIRGGRLYTWGAHSNGEGVNQTTPAFRGFLDNYADVAAGAQHAYALRSDGTLYSWGRNWGGELGLGDRTSRYLQGNTNDPARVGNASDWGGIAAGFAFGFALKNDGSIWAMGSLGYWLGRGVIPNDDMLVPTRIADGPARCGDDITQTGTPNRGPFVVEACDSGALNGNEGECSASCRCESTRVVYVDSRATGAGDGTSWADAFSTLQAAVEAEGACDTIWVAKGTYTNGGATTAPVVTMNDGTEIYGGFAGYETSFTQRDPTRNPTVLDGLSLAHHVVVGAEGGVLDGLTIRGGNANGAAPADAGGGLLLPGTGYDRFTLRRVIFEENSASTQGGAMYTTRPAELLVESCAFRRNSARNGGALAVSGSALHVIDTEFRANEAVSLTATGGQGGAIWLDASSNTPRLHNVLLVANSASNQGAALWITRQSWFTHLTAYGNTGGGEVVRNGHGSTSCTNCAFWNPGVPVTFNQGSLVHSCFAMAADTNGNVPLTETPFHVVGSGADAVPYLAQASPCRDAGFDATAYAALPDWEERTTTADGALDVTPVDIGYHWPSP